jgi:fumarate reductase subunit C
MDVPVLCMFCRFLMVSHTTISVVFTVLAFVYGKSIVKKDSRYVKLVRFSTLPTILFLALVLC